MLLDRVNSATRLYTDHYEIDDGVETELFVVGVGDLKLASQPPLVW